MTFVLNPEQFKDAFDNSFHAPPAYIRLQGGVQHEGRYPQNLYSNAPGYLDRDQAAARLKNSKPVKVNPKYSPPTGIDN